MDVDLSRLDDEAEHVDVVLPRRVLRAIDSYADRQGETRNGFLARAALDQMRRETASPSWFVAVTDVTSSILPEAHRDNLKR